MRLLLVEDDPMIGESLGEGLRAECYAVDWVRNGHDAELALAGFGLVACGRVRRGEWPHLTNPPASA